MSIVIINISRSVHLMKKMADRNLAGRRGTSCGICGVVNVMVYLFINLHKT
jgi:hypothetical protein